MADATQQTPDKMQSFSNIIKKHMTVFGPDITFAQLQKINGLQVDQQGNVSKISGDQSQIQQQLVDMWNQLSPFLAKQVQNR